jgi:hypothetical protein
VKRPGDLNGGVPRWPWRRRGTPPGRFPAGHLAAVAPLAATAVLLGAALPASARALAYRDVGQKQWARPYITWVTSQTVGGQHLLDDFSGASFRPNAPLTRAQLARVLVLMVKRQNDKVTPVPLSDMTASDPYFGQVEIALKLGLLTRVGDGFDPDATVSVWQADKATVLALKLINPRVDWSMLRTLDPVRWRPNPGWRPPVPRYFPFEVAARYLGLRYNHPYVDDRLEEFPTEAIRRDEMAYTIYQAMHISPWRVATLSRFDSVALPPLSDRQKQILGFALSYEGFPFVYGGEYPTPNSPYGLQAHGGFDCSGFCWWVMKIRFGYPIPVTQRTAAAMAAAAKPRQSRASLQPGDLVFFAPEGPRSAASTVYHSGIYLGNGWFINSTGSTDGVSLGSLDWQGWGWNTDFAWGRRLLKPSELGPSPSPTPTSTATPSSSPSGTPSPSPWPTAGTR